LELPGGGFFTFFVGNFYFLFDQSFYEPIFQ